MLDFESVARVLVDAPSAWLSESAIAAALGVELAELAPAVAGLVAGRLLDRWARPDGPVVILTALGARQLGVRLVEVPGAELYRWSADAASVRSTRPTRRSIERTDAHDALLREIPDRRPRPDRKGEPTKPRVLLWGSCVVPWSEDRSAPRPDVRCCAL